ncbi:MAG: transporter substrate-binding domain-containing protein [Candidimonas sp.]|nr:MAG: transporter substrate-binding domain-containing protein [Candidimonas sp.]TAM18774.1 MAG: transporter substrate-binding domain-containing protein [Candidimonas sp.]TAM74705.1 MAG: transporter substrate-binding domain-containing protein [Candidimonas sp.]
MSISRRDLLKLTGVAGAVAVFPTLARAQGIEKKDVQLAVGGQALIYYLPLTIAERKGYFKDEGLNATVIDFAGGSKALQAVVGGSADVVSGAFEHTIMLQSKGQFYRTFVQQGRAPMMVLAVSTKTMAHYKTPADLKGKKVGLTAPGSSTNMMVSFFLAKHGMKPSDVSFIGVGAGAGAITAMRTGQIDAICNVDPVISTLLHAKDIKIISDTRTLKDTHEIFGGDMPSGCLYTSQAFIDKNPNTVQALANAMVRADKWIQAASFDDIAKTVPKGYLLGDPDLYKLALKGNKEALSPDGMVPAGGPETALKAQAAYIPNFPVSKIDVSKIWTNDFAIKANKKYPHA